MLKTCPGCGKQYEFRQTWVHAKCVVANNPEPDEMVANTVEPLVANTKGQDNVVANSRSADRHADKEKRREYMRELMRARRAKLKS